MADAAPPATEIAVIGAGMAGLSAALFLARAGAEVTVLERAEPWGEASGANAGTLSLQVKILPVLALARRAIELWRGYAEEQGLDVGFGQPGGLRVATTPALMDQLRRYADRQRGEGVDTEWVEGAALHRLTPWLGPAVLAATICPEDAYSVPLLAGPALIAGVRRAGGRVLGQTPVEGIAPRGKGFRLTTPHGSLDCGILVIAAGAATTRLGALLGVALPLYVDVNMLSVTEPAPPLIDRVVTHIGGILSLKQHPNGTILIGGGWQGRGGYRSGQKEVDHERLVHNLRAAVEVVPALAGLRLVRSWAGFEPVTRDALPLLGRLPGYDNAYVSAGGRGGYHLGPAQALLLAELIAGTPPSLPIATFDPARCAGLERAARDRTARTAETAP